MVVPACLVKVLQRCAQPLDAAAVSHQRSHHSFLPSFELLDPTCGSVNACHLPIKKVPLSVQVGRTLNISDLREPLIGSVTPRILHHVVQAVSTAITVTTNHKPCPSPGLREKLEFRDRQGLIQARHCDPNNRAAAFVTPYRRGLVPASGIEAFALTDTVRHSATAPNAIEARPTSPPR
jgi:hypothetical protein